MSNVNFRLSSLAKKKLVNWKLMGKEEVSLKMKKTKAGA